MERFQFSLARELRMTRAELLRTMSTREYIKWIAFFQLEQEDQQRAMEDAQDRARAQQLAHQMSGR
mgnify:CR=1 FL=1